MSDLLATPFDQFCTRKCLLQSYLDHRMVNVNTYPPRVDRRVGFRFCWWNLQNFYILIVPPPSHPGLSSLSSCYCSGIPNNCQLHTYPAYGFRGVDCEGSAVGEKTRFSWQLLQEKRSGGILFVMNAGAGKKTTSGSMGSCGRKKRLLTNLLVRALLPTRPRRLFGRQLPGSERPSITTSLSDIRLLKCATTTTNQTVRISKNLLYFKYTDISGHMYRQR